MAKVDVYEIVNNEIVKRMENGIIPWVRPWKSAKNEGRLTEFYLFECRKYRDGGLYSLLNQFLLGEDGVYLTFNEARKAGGHVKKGAKSRTVVYWSFIEKDELDEDGKPVLDKEGKPKKVSQPFLRYYNVFNIKDCEGVKEKKWMKQEKAEKEMPTEIGDVTEEIMNAEKILLDYVAREGIHFRKQEGKGAYYRPSTDEVVVPLDEQFKSQEFRMSVWSHELTHSTGAENRLNRFTGEEKNAAFGSATYSKEELVAEIGSATLLRNFGIDTNKTLENSTAYIQNWLSVLKNDKKMLVSAAGRAEKAVKMILNITNEPKETESEEEQ